MSDSGLFIEDLPETVAGHPAGTATTQARRRPRQPITTQALGEEGGNSPITTLALGEEGGGGPTTLAVGEEGA